LFFKLFELLFILVTAHVLHLTQFVELAQGQASFTKITQPGLAVVLADVLISLWTTFVYFVENHTVIYTPGTPPAGGGAPAVPAVPGAVVGAPGTPPSGPAPSSPAPPSSSPVAMSLSSPAGVIPIDRKS